MSLEVTKRRGRNRVVATHLAARVLNQLVTRRRLLPPLLQTIGLAVLLGLTCLQQTHAKGTTLAGRLLRRADHGAQLHNSLREVRRRGMGDQATRRLPAPRPKRLLRLHLVHGAQTRQHAHHVPVHGRLRLVEGDGENRARGVLTDAGDFQKLLLCVRNRSVALFNNVLEMSSTDHTHLRTLDQILRSAVVPQAGPERIDLLLRCLR